MIAAGRIDRASSGARVRWAGCSTTGAAWWLLCCALSQTGCVDRAARQFSAEEQHRFLSSIAPRQIRILDSFVRPTRSSATAVPDGVEVPVAVLDGQSEPARLVGQMAFELYSHRQPSADARGRQLQVWQVPIHDEADQKKYWDRATRQYVFPLQIEPAGLPRDEKFVLVARFTDVWDEHLEAEAELDLSSMISELKSELRTSQKP